MKAREIFQELRGKKIKFSLRWRMTVLVGGVVLVSIAIALALATLLDWIFNLSAYVPTVLQLAFICLAVAMVAILFLSKIFIDPIRNLREGMQKVSDGDFSTTLQTKSSSVEIQEVIAGFNMMTQELSATEILQTDFVSNVSHEFKTPINAIEGYTTLLQNCDNLNNEQQEYVEKILFNTKRLSTLVGNILLLSKIENQSIRTHLTAFSLDEQIRQAIVALESEWEKKEVELDVDLETVEYTGNENLLYHVWSNLIGNAIKFGPQGGIVAIRLNTEGDRVLFTVEDNGSGLSPEAEKHIFDKFYQADSSHKQEGNGLGLALVRRILLISGGTVRAENRAEGGCRFTVTLPLSAS